MARVASIILFCFVALQLSHSVIGVKVSHTSSVIVKNNSHFYLEASKSENIDKCYVYYNGTAGTKSFMVRGRSENELDLHGTYNTDSCSVYSYASKNEHFGKYKIKGLVTNGTLLTEDDFVLYKIHEMDGNKVNIINCTKGQLVKLSVNKSEILKVCKNKMNKHFCPNEISIDDSELTCNLWKKVKTEKTYFNTTGSKRLKKTGMCEFEIAATVYYTDGKVIHNNMGEWNVEVLYGYIAIQRAFDITNGGAGTIFNAPKSLIFVFVLGFFIKNYFC